MPDTPEFSFRYLFLLTATVSCCVMLFFRRHLLVNNLSIWISAWRQLYIFRHAFYNIYKCVHQDSSAPLQGIAQRYPHKLTLKKCIKGLSQDWYIRMGVWRNKISPAVRHRAGQLRHCTWFEMPCCAHCPPSLPELCEKLCCYGCISYIRKWCRGRGSKKYFRLLYSGGPDSINKYTSSFQFAPTYYSSLSQTAAKSTLSN